MCHWIKWSYQILNQKENPPFPSRPLPTTKVAVALFNTSVHQGCNEWYSRTAWRNAWHFSGGCSRGRVATEARKSPSLHFFKYFTMVLTSTDIQCRKLNESIVCAPTRVVCNSFLFISANVCLNYFVILAGFWFMMPHKPDSREPVLPYITGRSGLNGNALYIVVQRVCPDMN